jgi:Zn finger protein HypA/HybF involved in hydrogenase expression
MFAGMREKVADLAVEGLTLGEMAETLGVTKATICYHLRRLGYPAQPRRSWDWDEVQRYYDAGHTARECMREFRFSSGTWSHSVRTGRMVARSQQAQASDALVVNSTVHRRAVKSLLIREGLKRYECEACGISEWEGERLPLELHHRNGVRDDNRLENLSLLCPNCHSQTDSWGGRNRPGPRLAA